MDNSEIAIGWLLEKTRNNRHKNARNNKYPNGTSFLDYYIKRYRLDWIDAKVFMTEKVRERPFDTNKDNSCLVRSFPKGIKVGPILSTEIDTYPIFNYFIDDLAERTWTKRDLEYLDE